MIGQTISHYRIIEKLGEGGMGIVYKAHDTKLNRDVALKFLSQPISVSEEDKARFLQEAEVISALNHPNIATIFDIDEVDGQKFLVLEYIPGGTLKSKLKYLKAEDKEFSLAEVLDYGIQAAQALAHAHRRQIIHRDVKTDNLMLTDEGKLKLTDFGLAKLRGSARVTKTGTTVGTAAYMSPEQIRGEEVDQRSDIFSFGVALYELLTSRLPFRGEFETAMNYSILNEDPLSVRSLRKETPTALEQIIHLCLEKDKTQRYQSAEEVVNALTDALQEIPPRAKVQRRGIRLPLLVVGVLLGVALIFIAYFFWPTKPSTSIEKSVAVLPLVDMSPQKDQDWFGDGMTETLIDRLSNVKGLKVPARTSAFAFKGKSQDIREIGRQLNVQTVLEGSIQKVGDRLRVTVQLINVADGYHLWSQPYDREFKDVFAIQDEISRAIVDALKLRLAPEEQTQITRHTIVNAQAYELHLRARYEMSHFSEEAYGRGMQLVTNGLQLIGENETLYGDKGQLYLLCEDFGIEKGEGLLIGAEECIKKIFALNPRSSYGHYLRGYVLRRRGKAQEAVKEFKQSLSIDPNNPDPIGWLAWVYAHSGKGAAAKSMVSKLVEIDPLSTFTYIWQGAVELVEGRFDSSAQVFAKARQVQGESDLFLYWQAKALAYAGRDEEAMKVFDLLAKQSPPSVFTMLGSFFTSALQNKKLEALQSATAELKQKATRDEMFPIWMAESFALINEKNEAIDWLEQGVKSGFINYPFLMEYDRFLASLRGEERFKKLLERVKYKWEHFEV